jgi:EAL domain-containing protein (putative c-di-GMP-specific phosphodiesterase class I)
MMVSDPARLAALRGTGLLDAAREQTFDRLTRLASRMLGVPVSVLTLVDEDRQFFLSERGVSAELAQARETPLSHSFCQHVVNRSAPLVVGDARTDPLVAGNLAVCDLDVIAYAGVPLRLSDGHVLGAFCAIEPAPRAWSAGDLELLQDLAELAVDAIEARQALAHGGVASPLSETAAPTARERTLLDALPGAHARGELDLVYQPLVHLASGDVWGVEALVRWAHPRLGAVEPQELIGLAERCGAIVALGEWVLDRACADVAAWRASAPALADLALAVNVAPIQLASVSFPPRVATALTAAGLPAQALLLEITEGALLDGRDVHRMTLGALRALGVGLALDRFGLGEIAPAHLAELPIGVLKLDPRLVGALHDDARTAALADAILAMADRLGLGSIAVGIERAEHAERLRAMGCVTGQGFALATPMDPAALAAWLAARPQPDTA